MNLFDELKNINAPVLAIQGTVDSYGSAEQLVQISKNLKISHRTEMIKDAGHNPHLQYQVQLINLLSAFIIQNTMTHEKKIQLC
jgi:pimeloyl-ACP methyl ester carboxylesterase